jgi:hypothetical protein
VVTHGDPVGWERRAGRMRAVRRAPATPAPSLSERCVQMGGVKGKV